MKSRPQSSAMCFRGQRLSSCFLLPSGGVGSTGCSGVHWYNLTVTYAGEGVEGKEDFALLSPSPFQLCFAWSNPPGRKEGGGSRLPKRCVNRSPAVGGCGGGVWCGCSGATRSLHQFGCPGVWEGRLSVRIPFPPPSVARCCCSDTPDPLDSGGSPSLCWTKDMKQQRIHTQAVQPSYSWARLSMLVASLMTTSTCSVTLILLLGSMSRPSSLAFTLFQTLTA